MDGQFNKANLVFVLDFISENWVMFVERCGGFELAEEIYAWIEEEKLNGQYD